jgi:hypothetical protein
VTQADNCGGCYDVGPYCPCQRVERLALVRDGTIVSGNGTEIDFRTLDATAEGVAAAFEAAFGAGVSE